MINAFAGIDNKTIIKLLIRHIFVASFALYFFLIVLEWWQPGFVLFYFNSDIIIFVSLFSGIGLAVTI